MILPNFWVFYNAKTNKMAIETGYLFPFTTSETLKRRYDEPEYYFYIGEL